MDSIFLSDFEQGEIGSDLFRHACLMGLDGMVSKHRETYIAAAGSGIGSRSKTGRIRRLAGFRISSETAPARVMRRFEVPEDNGFIAEWVKLRIRQKHHADRVPAGTHREDGDQTRSRASQMNGRYQPCKLGRRQRKGQALTGAPRSSCCGWMARGVLTKRQVMRAWPRPVRPLQLRCC